MAGTPNDGPDPLAGAAPERTGRTADERPSAGAATRPPADGIPRPPGGAAPPRQRQPPGQRRQVRRRAPVLVAAAVTTAWAAAVSYLSVVVVVGLVVLVGGGASVPVVFRFGTAGWLLAHGVPVGTSAGRIGLVPLAISVLAAWRVVRAGVHTARAIGARRRRSVRLAVVAAVTVGIVYGLLGALATVVVRGGGVTVPPVRSGLTCAAFGLIGAAIGALVESGVAARWWDLLPVPARDAVRTGFVAALLVTGAGAAVAGMAVAVAGGDASEMFAAYRTGVAGQAGLTLLCLVYAPNLAVWATAYLVGPGFVVGAGATVSAAKVSLGALPAVPVLAALPSTAVSGVAAPLLGIPLAGGMAAGWLLVRRRFRLLQRGEPLPAWGSLLGAAAAAGPAAGVLLGLAAWASGGPLGAGRLAVTGPNGWLVGLVGAGVVAVGAVIGAAATRVLAGGRRSGRYR